MRVVLYRPHVSHCLPDCHPLALRPSACSPMASRSPSLAPFHYRHACSLHECPTLSATCRPHPLPPPPIIPPSDPDAASLDTSFVFSLCPMFPFFDFEDVLKISIAAAWSSGMILAAGARSSGLNSQNTPAEGSRVSRWYSLSLHHLRPWQLSSSRPHCPHAPLHDLVPYSLRGSRAIPAVP